MKTTSQVNGVSQALSQAFTNAWLDPAKKFAVKEIRYKRRYWTGAAFAYEANWKTLRPQDFISIGTITQNLDTVKLNEFKFSNLTLALDNKLNKWLPENTLGYFGIDDIATSGYTAYRTLFQVWSGYEIANGDEELLCMFTGFLNDYNFNPSNGKIEFTLIGFEEKLQTKDAQGVSTTFTNEATSPATGDGIVKDFYTTSVGVAFLLNAGVKVNAVAMAEGIDYTISDTGIYNTPVKISFANAPDAGHSVTASGYKWLVLQKIETLIGLLCAEAGVTDFVSGSPNPVIFPNGVNGYRAINTAAGWNAGTLLQNISTTGVADSIIREWFLVDDFSGSNTWATKRMDSGHSYAISAGAMRGAISAASLGIGTIFKSGFGGQVYGTWDFKACAAATGALNILRVWFIAGDEYAGQPREGFYIKISDAGIVALYRGDDVVTGASEGSSVLMISAAFTMTATDTIRVTRTTAGVFELFINGVSKGTSTQAGYTYTRGTYLENYANYAGTAYQYFDDYNISKAVTASAVVATEARYESVEFDLASVPTGWGTLAYTQTLNGGEIHYYTNVRAPAGAWDGWVEISGGQIASAKKQCLKIAVVIIPAAGSLVSPVCAGVIANFTTGEIFIALADFTGMTCYSAIQKLARLCNYEWGFTSEGLFFFRSKSTSASAVLTLSQADIVEITSVKPGWGDIINVSQVRYDSDYYREYNSSSLPETHPNSQEIYGDRIRSEEASDFLIANDADLATGTAQITHDDNYLPAQLVQMTFRAIPHVDPSDIIEVNYSDDPLFFKQIFGDRLFKFGSQPFGTDDPAMLFRAQDFKIVGLRHKMDNDKTELILRKIL